VGTLAASPVVASPVVGRSRPESAFTGIETAACRKSSERCGSGLAIWSYAAPATAGHTRRAGYEKSCHCSAKRTWAEVSSAIEATYPARHRRSAIRARRSCRPGYASISGGSLGEVTTTPVRPTTIPSPVALTNASFLVQYRKTSVEARAVSPAPRMSRLSPRRSLSAIGSTSRPTSPPRVTATPTTSPACAIETKRPSPGIVGFPCPAPHDAQRRSMTMARGSKPVPIATTRRARMLAHAKRVRSAGRRNRDILCRSGADSISRSSADTSRVDIQWTAQDSSRLTGHRLWDRWSQAWWAPKADCYRCQPSHLALSRRRPHLRPGGRRREATSWSSARRWSPHPAAFERVDTRSPRSADATRTRLDTGSRPPPTMFTVG